MATQGPKLPEQILMVTMWEAKQIAGGRGVLHQQATQPSGQKDAHASISGKVENQKYLMKNIND